MSEPTVKIETIDQFRPQRANPNKHNPRGLALLDRSMSDVGYVAPMTATADGEVIDGSARLETAALRFGDEVIVIEHDGTRPIIAKRTDVPDAQSAIAKQISYRSNRISEVDLTWDVEQLAADIEAGVDLSGLWSDGELADLLGDAVGDKDAEPQVDKAAELQEKWQTATGQLWQLGDHRLICGDCTDKAVVERVMGGEKAEMVWTDPPYGVAVGDKNKYLNSIAPSNRVEENLQNDTVDEPTLVAMLCTSFDNAMATCLAGGAWYVAAPAGPLHVLFGQVLKDRGIWHQTIQWVKNNATFSPMGVDYHWRAEPIFYGWLPGGGHRWYGGRKQDTVWEIDRPTKSPEHPTMKPVELVARAIENSSRVGEIVLDPFLGSGTTLIACENLRRKCRAVEISPAYVAVAIQRWVDVTGGEPVLVG